MTSARTGARITPDRSVQTSPLARRPKRARCPGRSIAQAQAPYNNALERTRRGGVPAARAVIRVSPRRSTQCCTHYPKSQQ